MKRIRQRIADDGGFTLIELVLSALILAVVMAPLCSAFVLNLTTSAEASQRISNSADAQVLTTYFTNDVASSESFKTSGFSGCSGSPLMRLPRANGTAIDYVVKGNPQAQSELNVTPVFQLVRVHCGTSNELLNEQTMATSLRSQPVLKCDDTDCDSGLSTPLIVSLKLDEIGRPADDLSQDYEFTVTGTRRVTTQ